VAGNPGMAVTATVSDGAGRQNVTSLGQIPFASTVERFTITSALTADVNARFSRLTLDGTMLYASCGYPWNTTGESHQIFAFDTTKALNAQTPSVFDAGANVQNFVVRNGWAYVATDVQFVTVNLSTGAVHPQVGYPLNGNGTFAVAVSGNYAFVVAGDPVDTFVLHIYDITDPANPQFVREVPQFDAGADIWGIQTVGTQYLAIFEPYANTVGKVLLVDKSNINNLTVVGKVDIDDFADGVVSGNTIYAYGYRDGVAIIDIADPAHPALLATAPTPGLALGVAVSGTGEIAVSDGSAGVTFVDVTNRAAPVVKGSQSVSGVPLDVRVVGKTIYVAADRVLDAMHLP
jgi:hypothetical protein